jgi:hypothetical protein
VDNLPITLHKDFKEFANCLISCEIEFLLVGGYALAGHGVPRYTGDIDFWIDNTPDTCTKLLQALDDFGFGSLGLSLDELIKPGMMLQFGVPPFRIDVISSVSGLIFSDCYPKRVHADIFGIRLPVIDIRSMIANKIASNRPKDRVDVTTLTRLVAIEDKKQLKQKQ